jgi:magnesium transporter
MGPEVAMEDRELTENREEDLKNQILEIINSGKSNEEIREALSDFHENDIAEILEEMEADERKRLYQILGVEGVSEVLTYVDDASDYISEIDPEKAADVLENMDADDAAEVLENIDDEKQREKLLGLMDQEAADDVRLISSYDDDEIGSMMTTNFVTIPEHFTIKQAMRSLVAQAEENDNIMTLYVTDKEGKYSGAIELRDLVVARADVPLEDIISRNYPHVYDHEKITENIESLKDYAEDSIPVLNEKDEILGVITAQDITEAIDEAMAEDYAKLAGLTAEEDLNEKLADSVKKRIPWLILLLFLGIGVSTVVGVFEGVVAQIAIVMCFQSLILDMAGNVGTQSLAVTIRVLMDEGASGAEKIKFVFKEMLIGATNGAILGSAAICFVGLYLHFLKGYIWFKAFEISGCVGLALLLAMIVSSLMGTLIPMFFHKIKVDPAVASGPLITTVNDLVAVVTYYGLASLLLAGRI